VFFTGILAGTLKFEKYAIAHATKDRQIADPVVDSRQTTDQPGNREAKFSA
jgi:hypothetical protein